MKVRVWVFAIVFTGTFGWSATLALADPDVAIRDALAEHAKNEAAAEEVANGKSAEQKAAEELAKSAAKKAAGLKPTNPILLFFQLLLKPKPAY